MFPLSVFADHIDVIEGQLKTVSVHLNEAHWITGRVTQKTQSNTAALRQFINGILAFGHDQPFSNTPVRRHIRYKCETRH